MADDYTVSMLPGHPAWEKWLMSALHGRAQVKVKATDVEGLPAGPYAIRSVTVADGGPETTFVLEPMHG